MSSTTRVRLSPDERRLQLLELGVRLLSTRSLDELSIDVLAEEAGVSRGLLYHYFGGKQGYFEAVVQHAADDLYRRTAPAETGDALERLLVSITGYIDYVVANEDGYRSLVRAASGGNDGVRAIYDATFQALGDRFFTSGYEGLRDEPATRLIIKAWQQFAEALVLGWCDDPSVMTRDEVLVTVVNALPAMLTGERLEL